MNVLSFIVFAITVHHISARNENLPDFITPCNFTDKNLQECIRNKIIKALPLFAKGLPEYGIFSLDPSFLDDIIMDEKNLKLSFYKPKLYGVSKVTLKDFKLDARDADADLFLSLIGDIQLTADYYTDGKILILPLQGNGTATIDCHNMEINITCKAKQVKDSDNHWHMKLTSPAYKYDIESTVFNFKNLFNGNKELSDAAHDFANKNSKELMDELASPAIKQITTTIVKNLNVFLSKVGLEKMFINFPAIK